MTAGVIIGGSVLLFAVIVGAIWVFGGRAKQRLAAQYPPPGQMVDVGGYRMHIHCQGHARRDGGPTVVMDAAIGEPSLSWGSVPEQVAAFAPVCTYDRAGLGWSEASPQPRLASNIVAELHTLLTQAAVKPPYVLVGHSMGGLYACLYAHEHRDEVAGLVLVDSAHEEQDLRPPESMVKQGRISHRVAAGLFGFFRMVNSMGLLALMPGTVSKLWFGAIPDENRQSYIGLVCSGTRSFDSAAREFKASWDSLSQIRARRIRSLGDIPLVVLSRGRSEIAPASETSWTDAEKFDAAHIEMQTELAALSPQGKLIFTGEGSHYIQIDQPELVVEAIREVVEAAQVVD